MALDPTESEVSHEVSTTNKSSAEAHDIVRYANFKYLPPPRLYKEEDLGVPYPYVSTFAGPVTTRIVTDKLCLTLLATFAVIWIFLLFYAAVKSSVSLRLQSDHATADESSLSPHPTDFSTIIAILFSIMVPVILFSIFYLFLFLYIPHAMVYLSFFLWIITVIVVSLFIEAFIIAYSSFDNQVFKAFGFLNVSFTIRVILLVLVVYFKIVYAKAFRIAINFIILILQFVKEIRGVIIIPIIPSIIALIFTTLNIAIVFLLVYGEENLNVKSLEQECKCINGSRNGSSCNVPDYQIQRNCYIASNDPCSRLACSPSIDFSVLIICSLLFIIFFLMWCHEILFTVLMLVLDNVYAKFYFNQINPGSSTQALKRSVILVLRYHTGTAAYGALAMMFFQFPSFLVNRLDRLVHLKPYYFFRPIDSLSFTLSSHSSCFLLNFLSRFRGTAFVFTALFGFEFNDSTDYNFKLIYRNSQHFYVPDMLIDTIFKAAKWTFLCIISVISSYIVCGDQRTCFQNLDTMQTFKYLTVILLISTTSYSIISYCFSIITAAVYTVYICYLTESEMLSFKLPEEPARWEINHNRRRQLIECLHRSPPPEL